MSVIIKLSLIALLCAYCEAQTDQVSETALVPNLIKAAGYPVEKHRVTTDDGYMLQLHRIPAGRRSARRTGEPGAKAKKTVLIMHGVLGSSGDFVIMGPERSLSYLLADAGYDVWLGNMRGSTYSAHTTLKKTDSKFWNFSFHEHGTYDVPAMIDRILNITGLEKIMYVGYSMGTGSYYIMLSERPEYNAKLIAGVSMAPAVYLDNFRPVANLLMNSINLPYIFRSRSISFLNPLMFKSLMRVFCTFKYPEFDLCINLVNTIAGEDNEQYDMKLVPVYMSRLEPGSLQQFEHFGKIALTGVFTTWDGSLSSPTRPYNISNVQIPTTILYGENDQIVQKSQAMRLARQLNETGMLEMVRPGCSWPKFNHLDFTFAKDVGKLLNKPLIRHMDELYNKYGSL